MKNDLVCHSCGDRYNQGDKFCSGCGSKLNTKSETKADDVGKRKQVFLTNKSRIDFKQISILIVILVLFSIVNLYFSGVFDSPEVKALSESPITDPHKGIDMSLLDEIKKMEDKIATNPNDSESYKHLLHILKDAGLSEKAISNYEKYIQLQPGDNDALLEFAHLLHDNGKWVRAVEIYNIYLKNNPSDTDARVDQGVCYFSMKNYPEAIRSMEEALNYDKKHLFAHFNLGIVNFNAGNIEKGKEWMKKVIELDSNSDLAKQARDIINNN